MRKALFVLVPSVVLTLVVGVGPAVSSSEFERTRNAALNTYIHGMTAEIAAAEFPGARNVYSLGS